MPRRTRTRWEEGAQAGRPSGGGFRGDLQGLEGDGFEGRENRSVGWLGDHGWVPEDPRIQRCFSHCGRWGLGQAGERGNSSTERPCSVLSVGTLVRVY